MPKRRAFTLIELLVVVAIIALLMAILMPALQRVKKQAQAVACMSNLKQWGYSFWMYTDDNNGKFPTGESVTDGASGDWPVVMWQYYRQRGALTLCPSAKKPYADGGRVPFGAWAWGQGGWAGFETKETPDYGSYGMNEWANNPQTNVSPRYWRTRDVKQPDTIPLFFDCVWFDTYPHHTQGPPDLEGQVMLPNEMHLVCIDRHSGYANYVFADFGTVRKVGLKELWTFRWHQEWDTANLWTPAGGVQPQDWPQWMRNFKDY
ncbi:MAG: type II secretion system protein [Phycisphaerales bacterium]|nr:MAG: type II secretion system protein [Phycisphaerales bacterium]